MLNKDLVVLLEETERLREEREMAERNIEKLEDRKSKHLQDNWNDLFEFAKNLSKYDPITRFLMTNVDVRGRDNTNCYYGFMIPKEDGILHFYKIQKYISGYSGKEHLFVIVKNQPMEKLSYENDYVLGDSFVKNMSVLPEHKKAFDEILLLWNKHKEDIVSNLKEAIVYENGNLASDVEKLKEEGESLLDILS